MHCCAFHLLNFIKNIKGVIMVMLSDTCLCVKPKSNTDTLGFPTHHKLKLCDGGRTVLSSQSVCFWEVCISFCSYSCWKAVFTFIAESKSFFFLRSLHIWFYEEERDLWHHKLLGSQSGFHRQHTQVWWGNLKHRVPIHWERTLQKGGILCPADKLVKWKHLHIH